jgi:hypothetical protein
MRQGLTYQEVSKAAITVGTIGIGTVEAVTIAREEEGEISIRSGGGREMILLWDQRLTSKKNEDEDEVTRKPAEGMKRPEDRPPDKSNISRHYDHF